MPCEYIATNSDTKTKHKCNAQSGSFLISGPLANVPMELCEEHRKSLLQELRSTLSLIELHRAPINAGMEIRNYKTAAA